MTEFVLGKIKFTWKGNWAVSTAYEKDDIIKFGGNTYVCTTGHTTGGTIPDFYTDIAKWDVHVEGVTHKGDHADATFYKVNDIVKSGVSQYICTIQHTSTPTINLTNFTLYVQGGDVAAQSGKAGQFLSTDGTNTTWVDIVEAAPAALDTLNELAASLADDADFAGTMTTSLAGKEPTLTAGTTAQYYRGDKTWQTLTVDPTMGGDLTGTASNAQIAAGAVDLVHMSADSVDSDQYVDGSIDNVHLADNAVGLAEMAGLVRGKIIVGNATGDPSALAMGTSEQVLRVNNAGTDLEYADAVGGAAWGLKTSAYTAVAGDGVLVDTDSSAITITLPISSGPPSLGDFIRILDATGSAATNNITVARNGNNIQGAGADLTISTNRAAIGLVYVNATQGWVLIEN